ncbi:MAG: YceI family protein [Salibacteraceae bacterium]
MKLIKATIIAILTLTTSVLTYSFSKGKDCAVHTPPSMAQNINLFVSHGHCATPFGGKVEKLQLNLSELQNSGNPMEGASISFEINPNTFSECNIDVKVSKMKTPGLFINETNENMIFKSTEIYTMGIDWYQVNGTLSIKGVKHKMKFFVSGIREPQQRMATELIFEGQINLEDWGIDYDKIVNGKSNSHPTKWMHMNMRVKV